MKPRGCFFWENIFEILIILFIYWCFAYTFLNSAPLCNPQKWRIIILRFARNSQIVVVGELRPWVFWPTRNWVAALKWTMRLINWLTLDDNQLKCIFKSMFHILKTPNRILPNVYIINYFTWTSPWLFILKFH